MRTRRYSFKVSGTVKNQKKTAEIMKDSLNKGPESIIQYLYGREYKQKDRDMVDKIEFMTEDGKLSSMEVSTYDWLHKDKKEQIKEVMEKAVAKTGEDIGIDGYMKYIATDENLPEHLYHITENQNLDTIMKQGLTPKRGHNDWKSKKRCTYFAEAEYIVPWLGILENVENPVILEIETEKIPGIEQGRIWNDRDYVPGNIYSEHRTTETVPPEAVRVMSAKEVKALGVNEKVMEELMYMADPKYGFQKSEETEIKGCLKRLNEMGVLNDQDYVKVIETYNKKRMGQETKPIQSNSATLPWEGEDMEIKDSAVKTNSNLSTYLIDIRREEQFKSLIDMPNRDLCEMIRAHFNTHPAMPGEANLKQKINWTLNMADQVGNPQDIKFLDKESVVRAYVNTRIRETKFEGAVRPKVLELEHIADITDSNATIDKVNVELQKKGGDVYVMAISHEYTDPIIIGELPEKFLKNNPMNVDSCGAELQIVDYSNGKGKNISSRIIVDTDMMSGDVVELDNDMLAGLEEDQSLKK